MININRDVKMYLERLPILLPGKIAKYRKGINDLISALHNNVEGFTEAYNNNVNEPKEAFTKYIYEDFPNKSVYEYDRKVMYMYYVVPLLGMITSTTIELYKEKSTDDKRMLLDTLTWALVATLNFIEIMRTDYGLNLTFTAIK
jgi:hypothetical protein